MNLKKALRDLIKHIPASPEDVNNEKVGAVENLIANIQEDSDGRFRFALFGAGLTWEDETAAVDERLIFEATLMGREPRKFLANGFRGNYLLCQVLESGKPVAATDQLIGQHHLQMKDHERFVSTLRKFQSTVSSE